MGLLWINIAKVANLLGPGTYVPAVKSNNFGAGTLRASLNFRASERRSGAFRLIDLNIQLSFSLIGLPF